MSDLKKYAKGKQCQIRIPGVCSRNPETVVLCHLNQKSLFGCGMGMKVPDRFGAHGCQACHDLCDGRMHTDRFTPDEILIMHMEGVFRTMNLLFSEGKI